MSTHFKIVVPFCNVEKWIRATIHSVKIQDYDNYECVLIDDMSSDESSTVALEAIGDSPKFRFIKNKEKKYALGNTIQGVDYLKPAAEDVIMVLDGDDWFAGPSVLSRLDKEYTEADCWMTYGSYLEFPSGIRGKFAKQLPDYVVAANAYREYPWCTSQLRTFKYHLWQDIRPADLRDTDGKLYTITGDLAHIFPMLEMAGPHSRYIEDILYIYNLETPFNDHKKDNSYQVAVEAQIRAKQRYAPKENS